GVQFVLFRQLGEVTAKVVQDRGLGFFAALLGGPGTKAAFLAVPYIVRIPWEGFGLWGVYIVIVTGDHGFELFFDIVIVHFELVQQFGGGVVFIPQDAQQQVGRVYGGTLEEFGLQKSGLQCTLGLTGQVQVLLV